MINLRSGEHVCVKWTGILGSIWKHTASLVHSVHTCLLRIYCGRCPWGQIKREVQGVRRAYQWELAAWTGVKHDLCYFVSHQKSMNKSPSNKSVNCLKIWYKIINAKIYHWAHLTFLWQLVNMFSHPLEPRAKFTSVLSLFPSIQHSALLKVTPIRIGQMNLYLDHL